MSEEATVQHPALLAPDQPEEGMYCIGCSRRHPEQEMRRCPFCLSYRCEGCRTRVNGFETCKAACCKGMARAYRRGA